MTILRVCGDGVDRVLSDLFVFCGNIDRKASSVNLHLSYVYTPERTHIVYNLLL